MSKRPLSSFASTVLMSALLAAALPAHAQEDRPKTPLSEQMSGISKDLRALRKSVNDPTQKAAALQLVKDMEERATKAKEFDPSKAKEMPPADKDQFLADYRKQMDGLISDFQKLETAVNAGNTADATTIINKLQGDKREGHKKFNADDSRGPGGH